MSRADAFPPHRTSDRLLQAARWALLAFFIAMLAVTVVGIIRFPAYLSGHLDAFDTANGWSPEQTQEGLRQLGWAPSALGWIALARDILFGVAGIVLFALLWSRANTWFLVYVAFVFAIYGSGAGGSAAGVVGASVPIVGRMGQLFGALSWQFFFILFFFFPNGRPVPRWTRWVTAGWGLVIAAEVIVPGLSAGNAVLVAVSVALVLCAIGSQIYRYLRRSTPQERQQTKWVVYVLAVSVAYAAFAIVALKQFQVPTGPDYGRQLLVSMINWIALGLGFQLMPIIIALSILRYRLWDIDVVIRRTLVYAVVTALLALVFFGAVILFQRLFAVLSGQESPVAIVASTLIIAGLFGPLRRRVQDFVDRQFYRRRYDSQQVLAEFATVARDETDLDTLTGRLAGAISETTQPNRVAVWLRES